MEKLPVPASTETQEQQRNGLITTIGNKARGIKVYRQAKQELQGVYDEVRRAVSEQAFDDEGRPLPSVTYAAGLHLRSPMTEAEQERFMQEYHQNVADRWPEGEQIPSDPDLIARALSRTPGQMGDTVNCSMIGPIREVGYDTAGMTEKQVADLQHYRTSMYNYSHAAMRVRLLPVETQQKRSLDQKPEVLRMDNDPTHTVVIQSEFNGFARQEEIAKQILDCITETSVMQEKLPAAPLQLPPGE